MTGFETEESVSTEQTTDKAESGETELSEKITRMAWESGIGCILDESCRWTELQAFVRRLKEHCALIAEADYESDDAEERAAQIARAIRAL